MRCKTRRSRASPVRPAPRRATATLAAAIPRAGRGVGELLRYTEPPGVDGSTSDLWKSESNRSDRTTKSKTVRGGRSSSLPGRPGEVLKEATQGIHRSPSETVSPTRLTGATASSQVRIGHRGFERD